MKSIIVVFLFLSLFIPVSKAQQILNVKAGQEGKILVITYDLTGAKSGQTFDVSVYFSTDGGATFGQALNNISGQVGKEITGGYGKKIVWDVLAEVEKLQGSNIVFEVRAKVKGGDSFTDSRDGKTYKTVKIGNQTWMAENLKYLPSVVGHGTGSATTQYYYVYGYNGTNVTDAKATSNYTTYGVLYNWPAAMAGSASSSANPSGVQGVCPTGWHLPSDAEWTQLTTYLGNESVAGGKLKETGTTHWASPNTDATNTSGFIALPGGGSWSGSFNFAGNYGYWWSSTEYSGIIAWYRLLYYFNAQVYRGNSNKAYGFSCRCVKD